MNTPTDNETMNQRGLNRAEWIAAAAVIISSVGTMFSAGIEVQRINDHERRLTAVEAEQSAIAGKVEQLLSTTSRTAQSVQDIDELLKEQRERSK